MEDRASIEQEIERVLLARRNWVPSRELAGMFGFQDDRVFRRDGESEGLCSGFAISGNKGLKHITLATTAEWRRFRARLEHHAKSELFRLGRLRHRRALCILARRRPPMIFERDSGQILHPALCGSERR